MRLLSTDRHSLLVRALRIGVVGCLIAASISCSPGHQSFVPADALVDVRVVVPDAPVDWSHPKLSLVGLGDSVPAADNCSGCQSFVDLFALALADEHKVGVRVVNFGEGGATTEDLLGNLRGGTATAGRVSDADVVTVTIGANDVAGAQDALERGDCNDGKCAASMLPGLTTRVGAVLNRVAALRHGNHAGVYVTGYWNVFPDGQVALRQYGARFMHESSLVTCQVNKAIAAGAASGGGRYIDLVAAFKGGAGTGDPTNLLADDGDHPSQAGHQAIARQLAAAESSQPPTGPLLTAATVPMAGC
jgi:lysophospholipase L1-like esterase